MTARPGSSLTTSIARTRQDLVACLFCLRRRSRVRWPAASVRPAGGHGRWRQPDLLAAMGRPSTGPTGGVAHSFYNRRSINGEITRIYLPAWAREPG